MNSYQEFKTLYCSNIILFIILLFIIIYLVINLESIYIKNNLIINWDIIKSSDFVKPALITGIIFLIFHMIMTWDDEIKNENEELIIPKYKLGQQNETKLAQNNIMATNTILDYSNPKLNSTNNKYKILNNFDRNLNFQNPTLENFDKIGQNLSNSYIGHNYNHNHNQHQIANANSYTNPNPNPNALTDKMSNQNIFISQKNSGKYGIKFV